MGLVVLLVVIIMSRIAGQESRPKYGNSVGKEPHRKEYKGLSCGAISEEFFVSMNTFGIRHNTKSQKRLTSKKKAVLCDKLFAMAVYVLQTSDVNAYKSEIKDLREKD